MIRTSLAASFFVLCAMVAAPPICAQTTILYTSTTLGRIENCRCPSDPNGALEKRLSEIERIRELNPVLLLDSGDFVPSTVDPLGARAVLEVYAITGYDAVTLGELEFYQGAEIVAEIAERLPVVSANLYWQGGGRIGKPSITIERGGQKFFITAITSPQTTARLGPGFYEDFSIKEPSAALAEVVKSAPKDAHVIVLSHAGAELDQHYAKIWSGVDLIVAGHDGRTLEHEDEINGVYIVSAGSHARSLGIAEFRGDRVRAEVQSVHGQLPDDPRVVKIAMDLKRARQMEKTGQPEKSR